MKKTNNRLVLLIDDYKLLNSYLNGGHGKTAFDRQNAEDLHTELKKAKLVKKDDFPEDVVRLNSKVRIKAEGKDEVMELMLVTPDKADIKEKRISIMAPIGTALIGFRQGQKVKWQVPAGKKTFTIMEVINDLEKQH
jgi:regulator of nucleoside diphosphate kinase